MTLRYKEGHCAFLGHLEQAFTLLDHLRAVRVFRVLWVYWLCVLWGLYGEYFHSTAESQTGLGWKEPQNLLWYSKCSKLTRTFIYHWLFTFDLTKIYMKFESFWSKEGRSINLLLCREEIEVATARTQGVSEVAFVVVPLSFFPGPFSISQFFAHRSSGLCDLWLCQ